MSAHENYELNKKNDKFNYISSQEYFNHVTKC